MKKKQGFLIALLCGVVLVSVFLAACGGPEITDSDLQNLEATKIALETTATAVAELESEIEEAEKTIAALEATGVALETKKTPSWSWPAIETETDPFLWCQNRKPCPVTRAEWNGEAFVCSWDEENCLWQAVRFCNYEECLWAVPPGEEVPQSPGWMDSPCQEEEFLATGNTIIESHQGERFFYVCKGGLRVFREDQEGIDWTTPKGCMIDGALSHCRFTEIDPEEIAIRIRPVEGFFGSMACILFK